MIFDSHVHTEVSFDSEMALEQALRQAEHLGIGLILTEHMDLDYPEQGQFLFDVMQYFADYRAFRGDSLLLGIELGMQDFCAARSREIVESARFDYVLGSIHLAEAADLYYASFYEGRSKEEAYGLYFQTMLDCINSHPFIDALGHIDYIARYGRYENPEICYDVFHEAIDAVLRAIIERGIVLEINTRRFHHAAAVEALRPICRKYRELGGQLVTLGSDAHTADAIGGAFAAGMALAEACSLRPVYFKERKIMYMK